MSDKTIERLMLAALIIVFLLIALAFGGCTTVNKNIHVNGQITVNTGGRCEQTP